MLSHTWEDEEVTFQDMHGARRDGFTWVWIDTCCIDKSSSADISEAINSMYRWYQRSSVCYVYLADVPRLTLTPFLGSHSEYPEGDKDTDFMATSTRERHCFRNSRWLERGWTLQELIVDHLFHVSNSHHAFEPPTVTSRGILATLLTIPLAVATGAEETDTERPHWEKAYWPILDPKKASTP
ncbi:vegetative incompatibility protein HET-E-1-like protein 24 [Achaetomium macrosporum]|uniref:Vegetative incompatibility protein HET-E-1-like protein 24 n=1 Tax=Achaetomium macrosporum TaxID=79813 RepID=A0AAN7CI78_9PEZI|nr:vegetative incompatibility protein HET-E-1-like protein 24 [Achaetomium macrosporum]